MILAVEQSAGVRVALASEAERPAWDAYVAARSEATGYHEWEWGSVLRRAFGQTARSAVGEWDIALMVPAQEALYERLLERARARS